MKKTTLIFSISALLMFAGCAELEQAVNDTINSTTQTSNPLTNDEVIKGLKEALTIGTQNATKVVSQLDGFNKNPKIRIPFPPEAQKVKEKVIALGMQDQVDKFELTLNRAAEEAAKEAAPIFIDAVKNMSISDGFAILKGDSSAATEYLREKTSAQLKVKFKPVIHNAIEKVEVTKYWNPIITTYNKIPLVEKMNPDLEEYVTQKTMDGLFLMLAQEESKIRKDPAARVTDLLQRVFGNQ
jgi:hypothetical protein